MKTKNRIKALIEHIAGCGDLALEASRLREELLATQKVLEQWREDAAPAQKDLIRVSGELQSAHRRVDELTRKVREQTEADILLVSMRLVARIQQGEKPAKDDSDVLRQTTLQAQYGSMQAATPMGYLGMLGSLGYGAGGVLGRY